MPHCQKFPTPDGAVIVCGSRRKTPPCDVQACGWDSEKLCDWPMGDGKTCDKKLCRRHAKKVGPDKDYCPWHYAEHMNARSRP